MLQYDNPRLGIHWVGTGVTLDFDKARAGVDLNEPIAVFIKKMLAPPYSVTGPGHAWQVNDYGFAWAWVVLPLFVLVVLVVTTTWISSFVAIRILRVRTPGPADEATSAAMMLSLVAVASLYLSPALFIARYHSASLAMLAAALAWMVSRWRSPRLAEDVGMFASIGSFIFMCWAPTKHEYVYLYSGEQIVKWLKTPYPRRELEDISSPEGVRLFVAPANTVTATAREKELRAGKVIAYDNIDYYALLWNNDYTNKAVWVTGVDPLGDAERANAIWVYTRHGTHLHGQITASPDWQLIGPLEAENQGNVWRRITRNHP